MTVATSQNRVSYAGNDLTVAFSTSPVVFFDEGDLDVYLVSAAGASTLQTITTHYTVNGGAGLTGTVTMVTAPATGETLLIVRTMDLTQEVDFVQNDPSDAEVAEDALDKLTMIDQQLQEQMDRALLLPISSSLSGLEVPAPEASLFLRWNATEDGLENADVAGAGAIGIPVTVAEGGTGSTTAAGARTNLGLNVDAKGDIFVATGDDAIARKAVGSDGMYLSPSSGATDGLAYVYPPARSVINAALEFTAGSNALTCILREVTGSNPSDAEPVFVMFPNTTITNGAPVLRKVAAALSMVVSSGSTLGHTSAVAGAIYHYLIDNAGVVEYAVSTKFFGYSGIVSTTAEGGAGAADSQSVMYSTTARSNVPFVCVGRTKDTQTVAGTWTATPTEIQLAPFLGKAPTRQVFTGTGANTYTKPWDAVSLFARVQAAGGGGGSASSSGDVFTRGSGGGGGAYGEKVLLAEAVGGTETATVGAGGGAAAAGGNSSFGSLITANGGGAGTSASSAVANAWAAGGTSSGGDVNLTGQDGGNPLGGAAANYTSNEGGDSTLGQGARASASSTDGGGRTGVIYGGGGSGANRTTTGSSTGGSGANGIIVVDEFYV